jgi:hypothetical protein
MRRPVELHVGDRHAQPFRNLRRHIGRHALRVASGGLAGDQKEIAHIDAGTKDARRGKLGCDLAHGMTFFKNY